MIWALFFVFWLGVLCGFTVCAFYLEARNARREGS